MTTSHKLAVACTLSILGGVQTTGAELEKRTFTGEGGKTLGYRLLKPDGYDKTKQYPLVVFLHGAGERGDDNTKQLVHGVPEFAKDEHRSKYPCFLIAPQCPAKANWSGAGDPGKLVMELVAAMQKEFSIDAKRLYITGLSMGGFGTWDLIVRNPTTFAAAVPICGGGDPRQAEKIAKLPIWCFHGDKDTAVKVDLSRTMIEAIKKAGGEPKYTEYPGMGHASWVPAYKDAEMFKWLFSKKRE